MEQNVYVSTPTMSPIAAPAAAAADDDDDGDDAGKPTDDAIGEEFVPMLCLYFDTDEDRADQLVQTHHAYSTASTCFNHPVSLQIYALIRSHGSPIFTYFVFALMLFTVSKTPGHFLIYRERKFGH